MRNKLWLMLLLIVMIFMSGCLGAVSKDANLYVSWRSEQRITSLSTLSNDSGGIELNISNLSYTDSPMEGGWLIAESHVQGEIPGEDTFEFKVNSANDYKVEGNKVVINRLHADSGHLFVKYGDLEVISPFRIYQAISLGSDYVPNRQIYTHYDFESGVSNDAGDIYMESGSIMIWAPYGYTTMPKGSIYDLFWGDFPTDINFEGLDYTVGSFNPDYDTLYCIKTTNGYAKLIFTSYQSGGVYAHNFIYDYFPN